jgi:hypothetical protein
MNFCGLAKRTAQEVEGYLRVVEDLQTRGVPEERSMERLSERAAREIPKEGQIREKVLSTVVSHLERDQTVSAADIRVWVAMAEGKEPRAGKGAESPPAAPEPAPAPVAPLTFTRGLPGTPGAVVETVPATRKPAPEPAEVPRMGSANVAITKEDADVLVWLVTSGRARDPLDAAQRVFDEGIDRIRDHMDGEESRERDAREGK